MAVRLKGALPFHLGVTVSIEDPDYVARIEQLAPSFDVIELCLYGAESPCLLPEAGDVETLARIGQDSFVTWTVHMPLNLRLGDGEEHKRQAAVRDGQQVFDRLSRLDPWAWIVPCVADRRGQSPSPNLLRWQEHLFLSMTALKRQLRPERLCLENGNYPFHLLDPILSPLNLSVSFDVGRAHVNDVEIDDFLGRYRRAIRSLHIQGIRPTDVPARELLSRIFEWTRTAPKPKPVLSLQVLDDESLESSLDAIAELVAGVH